MTSDSLLHPIGSLPPEVYWRRRALAGVLAVLVGWLAWTAFPGKNHANAAQGPGRTPTPATGATASTTPSPAASTPAVGTPAAAPVVAPTTTPPAAAVVTSPPAAVATSTSAAPTTPAVPTCTAIGVSVSADHRVYPAGALPKFVLTVTNTSAAPCKVDVGTAARGFVVTSGSDSIWSSSDCTKTSANVQVFTAKQSVSYSHAWNRSRSSSAGCAAKGTESRPGTYKVTGHVGGLTSDIAVFELR